MASVSRFLTTKLRLRVNEAKSAVARPEDRKFLGFSISNDGSERRIAPKALDRFRKRIREQTGRTRGLSLPQIIEDLAPYLIGWGVAAGSPTGVWRMSRHPAVNAALRNHYFDSIGLPRLYVPVSA